MSFSKFESKFKVYKSKTKESFFLKDAPGVDDCFIKCINCLGGKSYNDGLYTVFDEAEAQKSTDLVCEVFPKCRGNITAFACDWLGRYFAVDARRIVSGKPQILMLETGAGEAMQIPVSLSQFHNEELISFTNEALASEFFKEWKMGTDGSIQLSECVGYKVPLFLGGEDVVANLELIDREVYTHICGQLRNQTLKLDEGQVIGEIELIR